MKVCVFPGLLLVLVLMLAAVAGGMLFLAHADLAGYFARYASGRTQREVTVESLRLGWQDGVTIELRGVRLANAPWSETPEMARIEAVNARLDPGALWRGMLRYETLEIAGLRVALERGPGPLTSWRGAARREAIAPGPFF